MDPDINAPRVQSWNVTLEKQIGANWGASVSYLGSYTDRLWGLVALNPGVYLGLGPCVLQGVSFPVCTTNSNLNQRRVLSLSGENPASAALISNLDSHAAVGTQKYRGLKLRCAAAFRQRRERQCELHTLSLLRAGDGAKCAVRDRIHQSRRPRMRTTAAARATGRTSPTARSGI